MSYVGTQAINGSLYKKLPFDPDKDFAPVATLATLPFVVVARPDASFKTVADLVAAAGKGSLTYGSAGNGSVNHLLGEMFNAAAGVKLRHIPYRGAAPAMTDLMGGQIDVVFTSLPSAAGSIRSGKLQPIAVTSAKRASAFDQVPTIAEAGFPSFDVSPWFGLLAPARTPDEVVAKINRDVNQTPAKQGGGRRIRRPGRGSLPHHAGGVHPGPAGGHREVGQGGQGIGRKHRLKPTGPAAASGPATPPASTGVVRYNTCKRHP